MLVNAAHACVDINPTDLRADDQKDQKTREGNDSVEDQVGEQQPGSAADGRGGEVHSADVCIVNSQKQPKSQTVSEENTESSSSLYKKRGGAADNVWAPLG